jgi:DNA-binding beta-propeller fold protein YncE
MRNILPKLLIMALTPLPAAAAPPPADPGYALVGSWQLGGSGGWDYLTIDSPRHRLFVTRADRVEVVDVGSGKVIGTILGTAGVHGVALAPELSRGFTSNGRANSVTVFNYASLAVERELPVPGENPDALLFEPTTQRLFLFNGRSHDATVVDARSLAVLARLPLPDKPEFAVADGAGLVFVNIESEQGQLVAIDAAKLVITATWPLPGCGSPSGLALDRVHKRLFSVCDGRTLAVTDAASGRALARLAIGEHPDAADYDSDHGLVFSSNGDGTLTIIRQLSANDYAEPITLPTQRGARTMAFDPATRKVYLATAEFGPTPPASADRPRPRPEPVPGSFTVLIAAPTAGH